MVYNGIIYHMEKKNIKKCISYILMALVLCISINSFLCSPRKMTHSCCGDKCRTCVEIKIAEQMRDAYTDIACVQGEIASACGTNIVLMKEQDVVHGTPVLLHTLILS